MRNSEIFDNFIKIAQDKGMISSKDFKKYEDTGRASSLDAKDIEALYNVKPESDDFLKYEDNIMEVAHPNSAVVLPAHDKVNGLVENNIQRQNIMMYQIQQPNNGFYVQKKLAEKDLTLSLVRIANDLDNNDKDELRALADHCLLQVKPMTKEAIAPLLLIGGLASALGALYAHQHLPNLSEGLKKDYDTLVSELDDFLNSNTNWGVGKDYDAELKKDVAGLKTQLNAFWTTYQSLTDTLRDMEQPKDAKALMEQASQPKTQSIIEAHKKLSNLIINMSTYIDKTSKNFSSEFYKQRHTADTGVITSVLEKLHFLGGDQAAIADDFQDVVNAIPPFKKSVNELLKMLQEAQSIEANSAKDLESSQAKLNSEFGQSLVSEPTKTPAMPASNKSVQDLDKDIADLGKFM